jgi:hypothetical protein
VKSKKEQLKKAQENAKKHLTPENTKNFPQHIKMKENFVLDPHIQ